MCSSPRLIASITLLLLLNCDLCQALSDGDIDFTTTEIPDEFDLDEEISFNFNGTFREVVEKVKPTETVESDNKDVVLENTNSDNSYNFTTTEIPDKFDLDEDKFDIFDFNGTFREVVEKVKPTETVENDNKDVVLENTNSDNSYNFTTTEIPDKFDLDEEISFNFNGTFREVVKKVKPTETVESDNKIVVLENTNSDNSYKNSPQFSSFFDNICLLNNLKTKLLWWSHENGSLNLNALNSTISMGLTMDLSYQTAMVSDKVLFSKIKSLNRRYGEVTSASFAGNNLREAPFNSLRLLRYKLKYLSLKNNNFKPTAILILKNKVALNEHTWANFPKMMSLLELDISNCGIEFVERQSFRQLRSLRHLFLSNNKITVLQSDVFYYLKRLLYLDLSFNMYFPEKNKYLEVNNFFNKGISIHQRTFRYLSNLIYLDLSHTQISLQNSPIPLRLFGKSLQYLNLCYTGFPLVQMEALNQTNLVAIDMSGNYYAGYRMVGNSVLTVRNSLRYMFLKKSNLKYLDWIGKLESVEVLDLSSNNINYLVPHIFQNLTKLEFLDLSDNHIGNWYKQAFATNSQLKFLNLRDNNINIITSVMLSDFQGLEYLGIGDNNFVCDCVLADVLEIAAANIRQPSCVESIIRAKINLDKEKLAWEKRIITDFAVKRFKPQLQASNKAITAYLKTKLKHRRYASRISFPNDSCSLKDDIYIYDKISGATLNFQLLDYNLTSYWCYNETKKSSLDELSCQAKSMDIETEKAVINTTKYILSGVGVAIAISVIGLLVYLKRWHIRYYYIYLKNAAMMSYARSEELINEEAEYNSSTSNCYDVFVSYCESDREWVLGEMIPKIDDSNDISICLHERDFQVGLTILQNIINCMDKSRCMLIVISQKFLLSNWCQFEMHLAQHRIFETNKEQLILVFLEDIPKAQRPKNLQYLMDVKTYIKWPNRESSTAEEKKLFWFRLRKALMSSIR